MNLNELKGTFYETLFWQCFSFFTFLNTFSTIARQHFKYLDYLLHFYIVEKVTQKAKTPKQRERLEKTLMVVPRNFLNNFTTWYTTIR